MRAFVAEMAERHGFRAGELAKVFAAVRPQPSVLGAIAPAPPGVRSWRAYRSIFVSARRIDAGVAFWRAHADALDRAASTFGVPPEVIVSIIGVETEYGRNQGGYRVLDALATLAFDYPRRAEYFRGELEQYLLYARETRLDVTAVKGSFAGAIGIPQFMPTSIRRWAVDFDGDGRRELRASAPDAIGSVGNFLAQHGWSRGGPTVLPARVDGAAARAFADGDVVPVHRPEVLRAAGVEFGPVADELPAVLIELESPDAAPVYLVGFQNFYAVTRYNRSSFYAAAVLELAEALRSAAGARPDRP